MWLRHVITLQRDSVAFRLFHLSDTLKYFQRHLHANPIQIKCFTPLEVTLLIYCGSFHQRACSSAI